MLTKEDCQTVLESLELARLIIEHIEAASTKEKQYHIERIESAKTNIQKIKLGKIIEFPDVIENSGVTFCVKDII
jgi:hypothetical protein